MYELLQVRSQLEALQYRNEGSLFELRIILMNAGTLLTARHLANQQEERDIMIGKLLLITFRNLRHYYHTLERVQEGHEQWFVNIREMALQDFVALFRKLRKPNVVDMPQEQPLMSMAR